ncbi:MAG: hypothetical protein KGM24_14520 [Elusimicrobia bacterium]|nr:hypothetical protein [Elusimicrobiota bacterium]
MPLSENRLRHFIARLRGIFFISALLVLIAHSAGAIEIREYEQKLTTTTAAQLEHQHLDFLDQPDISSFEASTEPPQAQMPSADFEQENNHLNINGVVYSIVGLGNYPTTQPNEIPMIHAAVLKDGRKVLEFAESPIESPSFYRVGEDWVLRTPGHLFLSGRDLESQLNVDEIFSYTLLNGKPFYIFRKDSHYRLSYDGTVLANEYDQIVHDACCEYGVFNPLFDTRAVAFYGRRGKKWFFTLVRSDSASLKSP